MLAALLCAAPNGSGGGPQWGDLKPAHPNYRQRQKDDLDTFLRGQIEQDEKRDAPVEAKGTGRQRVKAGKRVLRPAGPAEVADVVQAKPMPQTSLGEIQALTPAYGIQSRLWLDRRQRLLEQALMQRRRDDEEALMMILLTLD